MLSKRIAMTTEAKGVTVACPATLWLYVVWLVVFMWLVSYREKRQREGVAQGEPLDV